MQIQKQTQTVLRVYFLPGCIHCMELIKRVGQLNVPTQLIDASQDDVVGRGVVAAFGGREPSYPVLIDFVHGKTINGNNRKAIDELLSSFIISVGSVSPNANSY